MSSSINLSTKVLVVGAGPAGLATAAACLASDVQVVILEQAPNISGCTEQYQDHLKDSGVREILPFSEASIATSPSQRVTVADGQSYLSSCASRHNILPHVRLSCRLTHLAHDPAVGPHGCWRATFQDLAAGTSCQATAELVVLCVGHELPAPDTQLLIARAARAAPEARLQHALRATTSDVLASPVTVVGDGAAAYDTASSLALLKQGKGVTLIQTLPSNTASCPDGTTIITPNILTTIDGSALLDAARRRALHAALQPHPALPPSGGLTRALRAPTKCRFWAYFLSKATTVVSRNRTPHSGSNDLRTSPPTNPKSLNKRVEAAPQEPQLQGTASREPTHEQVMRANDRLAGTTASASQGGEPLVLWAPSLRNPLVMPFLDSSLRRTLVDSWGAQGDDMVLYRGLMHHEVPGLAFVGWQCPVQNSLVVLELQARWLLALYTGKIALPSHADMRQDIARQITWRAAALVSPLMSPNGSLARQYEQAVVRQLMDDLKGDKSGPQYVGAEDTAASEGVPGLSPKRQELQNGGSPSINGGTGGGTTRGGRGRNGLFRILSSSSFGRRVSRSGGKAKQPPQSQHSPSPVQSPSPRPPPSPVSPNRQALLRRHTMNGLPSPTSTLKPQSLPPSADRSTTRRGHPTRPLNTSADGVNQGSDSQRVSGGNGPCSPTHAVAANRPSPDVADDGDGSVMCFDTFDTDTVRSSPTYTFSRVTGVADMHETSWSGHPASGPAGAGDPGMATWAAALEGVQAEEARYRRTSGKSLPLLKLLPLDRWLSSGPRECHSGSSCAAATTPPPPPQPPASPVADLSSRVSPAGRPHAPLEHEVPNPTSAKRTPVRSRLGRAAPRRSLSYSDVMTRSNARSMHPAARPFEHQDLAGLLGATSIITTSAHHLLPHADSPRFPGLDESPADGSDGAVDALAWQLSALRSHLRNPSRAPYPAPPFSTSRRAPNGATSPLGPNEVGGCSSPSRHTRPSAPELPGLEWRLLAPIHERHEAMPDAAEGLGEVASAQLLDVDAAPPEAARSGGGGGGGALRRRPPARSQTTACLLGNQTGKQVSTTSSSRLLQGLQRVSAAVGPNSDSTLGRASVSIRAAFASAMDTTEALLMKLPSPRSRVISQCGSLGGASASSPARENAVFNPAATIAGDSPSGSRLHHMASGLTALADYLDDDAEGVQGSSGRSGQLALTRNRRNEWGVQSAGATAVPCERRKRAISGSGGAGDGSAVGNLTSFLGGILGDAAEAARLPYRERIQSSCGSVGAVVRTADGPLRRTTTQGAALGGVGASEALVLEPRGVPSVSATPPAMFLGGRMRRTGIDLTAQPTETTEFLTCGPPHESLALSCDSSRAGGGSSALPHSKASPAAAGPAHDEASLFYLGPILQESTGAGIPTIAACASDFNSTDCGPDEDISIKPAGDVADASQPKPTCEDVPPPIDLTKAKRDLNPLLYHGASPLSPPTMDCVGFRAGGWALAAGGPDSSRGQSDNGRNAMSGAGSFSPAGVVMRATQARQNQLVSEISSRLRDALARRAVMAGAGAAANTPGAADQFRHFGRSQTSVCMDELDAAAATDAAGASAPLSPLQLPIAAPPIGSASGTRYSPIPPPETAAYGGSRWSPAMERNPGNGAQSSAARMRKAPLKAASLSAAELHRRVLGRSHLPGGATAVRGATGGSRDW